MCPTTPSQASPKPTSKNTSDAATQVPNNPRPLATLRAMFEQIPERSSNDSPPPPYQESAQSPAPTTNNPNPVHPSPNPVASTSTQGGQGAQPPPGYSQQAPAHAGNYPPGHPYYASPYYAQYLDRYEQYGAGNYAGGPHEHAACRGGSALGGRGSARGSLRAHFLQQYPQYAAGNYAGGPSQHGSISVTGGFGEFTLYGRDSALGGRAGSAQSGLPNRQSPDHNAENGSETSSSDD